MPTDHTPEKPLETREGNSAHTTNDDFTGARRDSERNTTDEPGAGSHPAEGDKSAPSSTELGRS